MKSLEPPDTHHLSAAIGWLGLGNWREAAEELEKITPALRHHVDVLLVRYDIFARGEKWDRADEVVHELMEIQPTEPQFWIWHAYAVRRMAGGGIRDAKKILSQAVELFPAETLIKFNLACYECQLENLPAAWEWMVQVFNQGDTKMFKAMALQDKDLEPLWSKIRLYRPPPPF